MDSARRSITNGLPVAAPVTVVASSRSETESGKGTAQRLPAPPGTCAREEAQTAVAQTDERAERVQWCTRAARDQRGTRMCHMSPRLVLLSGHSLGHAEVSRARGVGGRHDGYPRRRCGDRFLLPVALSLATTSSARREGEAVSGGASAFQGMWGALACSRRGVCAQDTHVAAGRECRDTHLAAGRESSSS